VLAREPSYWLREQSVSRKQPMSRESETTEQIVTGQSWPAIGQKEGDVQLWVRPVEGVTNCFGK
jgi:hypothetical protein